MNNRRPTENAAMRLAELSREIDELERGRIALLKRVETTRTALLSAGDRAAALRATVDLMCEHMSDVVVSIDDIHLIEDEIRELGPAADDLGRVSTGQSFESDSLTETIDEAEQELERLSEILVEGKARNPRGH
jgi:chromosome segregation ATPase